eukprot:TRINITY_DN10011_c0_g1_i3.p1 TRINITY_DN10011_c0_g1~~TRINITY_DN10011_c0_g1_i3.p1  ORF type:complete len:324 (+),score=87.44 TRINITY_DN10011_c0_g1_i3:370-1341(+)
MGAAVAWARKAAQGGWWCWVDSVGMITLLRADAPPPFTQAAVNGELVKIGELTDEEAAHYKKSLDLKKPKKKRAAPPTSAITQEHKKEVEELKEKLEKLGKHADGVTAEVRQLKEEGRQLKEESRKGKEEVLGRVKKAFEAVEEVRAQNKLNGQRIYNVEKECGARVERVEMGLKEVVGRVARVEEACAQIGALKEQAAETNEMVRELLRRTPPTPQPANPTQEEAFLDSPSSENRYLLDLITGAHTPVPPRRTEPLDFDAQDEGPKPPQYTPTLEPVAGTPAQEAQREVGKPHTSSSTLLNTPGMQVNPKKKKQADPAVNAS